MINKNTVGFTIVELLLTIAICGIMIPSLALGLQQLTITNNRARDLALVNMLVQNKAELLRSTGFNGVPVGSTDFTADLPNTLRSPKSATYAVTNPTNGIKEILVTINYNDTQRNRAIQYKTIISEIGVGQ